MHFLFQGLGPTKILGDAITVRSGMKDFFISYNSADERWAEWIAWQLEDTGYSVIIQAWDFRPSHNFVLEMQRALEEAERLVSVLSPGYLNSSFTQSEWAAKFAEDPTGAEGKLVPIRVRECQPKGLLRSIVYVDLVNVNDERTAIEKLLSGVKLERAKPTKQPPYPGNFERVILEKPKFPGVLPIVWNVPLHRNPNFSGRDSLFSDLQAALNTGQPVALHGLGGMGKTQIAVEYAYRYGSDYEAVWWVRSEESATLAGDYAELAGELNLPHLDGPREVIKAVRLWLRQNDDWLLIFDNAEDPSSVLEYLPQSGSGHMIITSRDSTDWGSIATPLPIREFDREESIEFLGARTKTEDETTADALAEALGDLPLALEQAGAYINRTGIKLVEYLELFKNRRKELWNDERPPLDYHKDTVATTWTLAMDRIKEEAPAGSDLLNLCAFMAPDDIPRKLFSVGGDRLQEPLVDLLALNRATTVLRRYSLVDADNEGISVHRLVQTVTRDRMTDEEQKKWVEAGSHLIVGAFPRESDDVETWPQCSRLLSHALTITEYAERLGVDPKTTQSLLNRAGLYMRGCADLYEAKSVFNRALSIAQKVYGHENEEVATIFNNLSLTLKDLGDLNGAKENCEEALKIDEAVNGFDHPNVARDANNLGNILLSLNKPEDALINLERALQIAIKNYGLSDPRVGTVISNIGNAFLRIGKSNMDIVSLLKAQEYFEKALEIHRNFYKVDHPNIGADLWSLGRIHVILNDFDSARTYFDEAIQIYVTTLGDDHPKTINARRDFDSYILASRFL